MLATESWCRRVATKWYLNQFAQPAEAHRPGIPLKAKASQGGPPTMWSLRNRSCRLSEREQEAGHAFLTRGTEINRCYLLMAHSASFVIVLRVKQFCSRQGLGRFKSRGQRARTQIQDWAVSVFSPQTGNALAGRCRAGTVSHYKAITCSRRW
jgi:hypothetical protein